MFESDPHGYNTRDFKKIDTRLGTNEDFKDVCDAVRYWIEYFGIDGIRLDVAYSLDFDFLRALRRFTDSLKADFFRIGELLHGDYSRWVNPEILHSATNYECYKGLYSSFNSMNLFEICHSLKKPLRPGAKVPVPSQITTMLRALRAFCRIPRICRWSICCSSECPAFPVFITAASGAPKRAKSRAIRRYGLADDYVKGGTHDFGGGSELPPLSTHIWRCK